MAALRLLLYTTVGWFPLHQLNNMKSAESRFTVVTVVQYSSIPRSLCNV